MSEEAPAKEVVNLEPAEDKSASEP